MRIKPLYLANIILTIILLTSILSDAAISKSGTASNTSTNKSQTASTPEYDPWADLNGDGTIDIFDIVQIGYTFGTSGDPTRNVNITNWPTQQPEPSWTVYKYRNFNMSFQGGSYSYVLGFSGGYSRMYIAIDSRSVEVSESVYNKTVYIGVSLISWSLTDAYQPKIYDSYYFGTLPLNITYHKTKTPQWFVTSSNPAEVKVKGPYFGFFPDVSCSETSVGWISFDLWVYLRNE